MEIERKMVPLSLVEITPVRALAPTSALLYNPSLGLSRPTASERGYSQDAENVALLTRPTQARQDAPFPVQRSRIVQILNVPPGYASGPPSLQPAWDEARPLAKRLSWQTQGGRVK